MNIKNNQQFKNTEANICNTMLSLLDKKELNKITVSEICKKASINRSTFYAHFEDIPNLIRFLDRNMRKQLMDSFPGTDYKNAYASGSFLLPFLSFVKKHASFYKASLVTRTDFPIEQGYDSLMSMIIKPLCIENGITSETQMKYYLIYYQAGFTMVLKHWVLNGCSEPIPEVEQYLKQCMHLPIIHIS